MANEKWYSKYPRQEFAAKKRGYFTSMQKAKKDIENGLFGRHYSEPWIQLVRENADGWGPIALGRHDRLLLSARGQRRRLSSAAFCPSITDMWLANERRRAGCGCL